MPLEKLAQRLGGVLFLWLVLYPALLAAFFPPSLHRTAIFRDPQDRATTAPDTMLRSGALLGCAMRIRYRLGSSILNAAARSSSRSLSSPTSSERSSSAPEVETTFQQLNLQPDIQKALSDLNFTKPTPVQAAVIPMLLRGENLVMAAATGSGKTLTYVLPIVDALKKQEGLGYKRMQSRPRCLILVPTRDLARQVLGTVKSISHHAKLSSCAVLGGEPYAQQTKMLSGVVDVVVASPGRLLQHKEQGNVYFGHVTHVIIDEVDTMLTQGFGADIRSILQSTALHTNKTQPVTAVSKMPSTSIDTAGVEKLQVIMASATITKPVRALLSDIEGFDIKFSDPSKGKAVQPTNKPSSEKSKLEGGDASTKIDMKIIEVSGFHKSLPNVRHSMEDIKGRDKLLVLDEIIQSRKSQKERTMIFCNTIDSCRAVAYHLEGEAKENADRFVSYHGDLNSDERESNLKKFRAGDAQFLVCTDLAARGLDIPSVDHIIMFDFPLNPIDYLHRSGRTGRAGRAGRVTALVAKRDHVLSKAIQVAISKNLPLDQLSSSKRDYEPSGKLASMAKKGGPKGKEGTGGSRLIPKGTRAITGSSTGRSFARTSLMKRGRDATGRASTSTAPRRGPDTPRSRSPEKDDARKVKRSSSIRASKVSPLRSKLMSQSLKLRKGRKGGKPTSSRSKK